jgi:hypothetical protein
MAAWKLRRRVRRRLFCCGELRDRNVRILQHGQMYVVEGEHNLQRQRDQRQHNTVSLMPFEPAHPRMPPDASPHLRDANVTMLHEARGEWLRRMAGL